MMEVPEFTRDTLMVQDKRLIYFEKFEIAYDTSAKLLDINRVGDIGDSYHSELIFAVERYNASFQLLCSEEFVAEAAAFIRIQVDNLLYLYAEFLYPSRVLNKVYPYHKAGKDLGQIKIANKPIMPNELLRQLEERFSRLKEIWDLYCKFIHPSNFYVRLTYWRGRTPIIEDMVYINQAIATVLTESLQPYEDKLAENGLFEEYQQLCNEELQKFKKIMVFEDID